MEREICCEFKATQRTVKTLKTKKKGEKLIKRERERKWFDVNLKKYSGLSKLLKENEHFVTNTKENSGLNIVFKEKNECERERAAQALPRIRRNSAGY
jgi:hypothetical protein